MASHTEYSLFFQSYIFSWGINMPFPTHPNTPVICNDLISRGSTGSRGCFDGWGLGDGGWGGEGIGDVMRDFLRETGAGFGFRDGDGMRTGRGERKIKSVERIV